MIQNIGCQILGIFTIEHLGCDFASHVIFLIIGIGEAMQNWTTVFCVAEMTGLTLDWSIGLPNDEIPKKCNL